MMRLTMAIWWSLALVWLLTTQLGAQPGHGSSAPSSALAPNKTYPREVQGYGRTYADAQKDALKHLGDQLVLLLHSHNPPLLSWEPSLAELRRHFIQGEGVPGPDFVDEHVTRRTWIYPVKPLDHDLLALLNQNAWRIEQAGARTLAALQFFGGIFVLLAVLLTTLKIDDRLAGRYRSQVHIAGGLAVFLVLVGWWFFR